MKTGSWKETVIPLSFKKRGEKKKKKRGKLHNDVIWKKREFVSLLGFMFS